MTTATNPSLSPALLVEIITTNGLSVRQIPEKVVSKWAVTDEEIATLPADAVIEHYLPTIEDFKGNQALYNDFYRYNPKGRKYYIETRIPKNAGYWMTKKTTDTSESVKWFPQDDCLAPTLAESVALWVVKQSNA